MTPRLPFLVLVTLVAGGIVAASAQGSRPTLVAAPPPVAGLAAPATSAEGSLASTWYCAAGTARRGGLADHEVVVANPTDDEVAGYLTVFPGRMATEPAPADQVARFAQQSRSQAFTVPAGGRGVLRLAELRSAPLASALVELDRGGVAVEHQVVGPHGRDVAPCASGTAPDWHFAWGSTERDAREVLVLFNPFPNEVTVDGTFATETGVRQPLSWQGLTVPAHGVLGVDVGHDVTRRGQVAATIRARGGGRLVIDRLQLFDGSAGRTGLSLALGQPTGVEMSVFAHGRTDDRTTEQIVLYNPGERSAEVEVAVQQGNVDGPSPQPFGVVVRPGRFEVVDYDVEERVARGVDHTTVVRSRNGVPVVAERVLSGRSELSASPGALFGATSWVVPTTETTTTLTVVNPDPERAVEISVAAPTAAGLRHPTELGHFDIPAAGRVVVPVPADALSGASVGTVVLADLQVIVEWVITRDGAVVAAGPGIPASDGLEPLL